MAEDVKAWFTNFNTSTEKLKEQAPGAMNGFDGMFARIMKAGVVSIDVAIQCEPCIRLHMQKCLDVGCTKEEILKATSVAVMMSDEPAYTPMPMVIETLDALQA
jgi:AhpD family alkylhydroperoxidase